MKIVKFNSAQLYALKLSNGSFNALTRLSLLLGLSLSLTSCFKTSEDIQREQSIDQLASESKQSRNVVGDIMVQTKAMQEQLNVTNGRIEVLEHQQNEQGVARLDQLEKNQAAQTEEFMQIKASMEELKKNYATLKEENDQQKEYLKNINDTLRSMTTSPRSAETYKDKKKKLNLNNNSKILKNSENEKSKTTVKSVDSMEQLLKEKKYSEVIDGCREIVSDQKISEGKKNRCHYASGLAHHELGHYDDALIDLGQIYNEWPKSSLAAPALLQMGKSLASKGQTKQSQLLLKKIISEYPDSESATEAKKLLK